MKIETSTFKQKETGNWELEPVYHMTQIQNNNELYIKRQKVNDL